MKDFYIEFSCKKYLLICSCLNDFFLKSVTIGIIYRTFLVQIFVSYKPLLCKKKHMSGKGGLEFCLINYINDHLFIL